MALKSGLLYATAAANTAVVVTQSAGTGLQRITRIIAGYDGSPTGGMVTIQERTPGTDTVVATIAQFPITSSGTHSISFEEANGFHIRFDSSKDVAVVLAAGGSGVIGRLTVQV